MAKKLYEMELERPARKGGADRYVDKEGFTLYVPQDVSRADTGKPAQGIMVSIVTLEKALDKTIKEAGEA